VAVAERPVARAQPAWAEASGSVADMGDIGDIGDKHGGARGDDAGDAQRRTESAHNARRADAGRHFLKFFLPILPVMTFVCGFLYWYIAQNVRNAAPSASLDATIPLMGGVLLGLLSTLLCVIAYLGYLNVRDRELATLARQTHPGR